VWRQSNLTWKKPPAELELKERYAEAAILYFSPDHRFVLLYGTVIQGPTSEAISGGDGRVVYFGTWKLTDNSLHVEYRLVSRTVAKEGETLPGPVQSEDVRVRSNTLLFQKDHFARDKKLDGDDEFEIILAVPTTTSDLPTVIAAYDIASLPLIGGPMHLKSVPVPAGSSGTAKKIRSWQCLYLWRCSSHGASQP